jgi:hypothetical protein
VSIERTCRPDWRDPAAYAPLLEADRSLFAWEWLRRNADYRLAAEQALSAGYRDTPPSVAPGHFGLVAFESPRRAVPEARPCWRSDCHPYVLLTDAGEAKPTDDTFDPSSLGSIARIMVEHDSEQLLLSDGLRSIRLDGARGQFSSGPACLRYRIEGLVTAEPTLLTLRRFLAFCRAGGFSRSLHRREMRARRWILMLRACDGLASGADQRAIAAQLFSRSACEPRWRSREPSVRLQAQRLVRDARLAAAGGYRALLR